MKNIYEVEFRPVSPMIITVEADTEEKAIEIADDMVNGDLSQEEQISRFVEASDFMGYEIIGTKLVDTIKEEEEIEGLVVPIFNENLSGDNCYELVWYETEEDYENGNPISNYFDKKDWVCEFDNLADAWEYAHKIPTTISNKNILFSNLSCEITEIAEKDYDKFVEQIKTLETEDIVDNKIYDIYQKQCILSILRNEEYYDYDGVTTEKMIEFYRRIEKTQSILSDLLHWSFNYTVIDFAERDGGVQIIADYIANITK